MHGVGSDSGKTMPWVQLEEHPEGYYYTGYAKGIPRLGIPSLKLNDGPQGYRDSKFHGTTTSFSCGLGVGATFDIKMAKIWGV